MSFYEEEKVREARILLVGAGGIGCELLKNLVLSGFQHITIIDLDTIDISNLNRQLLFRKEHVGKSKAQVAKDNALSMNPDIDVVAHHDSIMKPDYGVPFFKTFTLVLNALDNGAARSHVNRMCLAADIPLIESGTAGYLGQVSLIKKGLTACYDCYPKPTQKTFPGCTIRNTPSELIHCVVWAKHLFNQLFGESDPDQEVSPDTEDPEAAGDAGKNAVEKESKDGAIVGLERKSTRLWAQEGDFNSQKLFNKFFNDDIKYLLSMSNLWKKRIPPSPIDIDNLPRDDSANTDEQDNVLNDQKLWNLAECVERFHESINNLKEELNETDSSQVLVWDKDNESAMNFVTSAANIRAFIFHIPRKSKFDIKSMAGNIIPAIATTNAIAAGLIILEAFKVLSGRFDLCKAIYINRQPTGKGKLLVPCALEPINPKCYVCSEKREITLSINIESLTTKAFEDKILKGAMGMVAPDVEIDDGKGTIIISSEEGETEDNWDKTLAQLSVISGSRLKCDDFLQEYNVVINIHHCTELPEGKEFEIVGDIEELQKNAKASNETKESANELENNKDAQESDDDDLEMLENYDEVVENDKDKVSPLKLLKRKRSDDSEEDMIQIKKANLGTDLVSEDDVMVVE